MMGPSTIDGNAPQSSDEIIVRVKDLSVGLRRGPDDPIVHAVNGVSFDMRRGSRLGIVGESGCGKSTTAMAILRLLPGTASISGQVQFQGEELLDQSEDRLRQLRGRKISMIFQDPMVALDPLFTVGEQLAESLRIHLGLQGEALRARQIAMLEAVGISSPETRLKQYPHQLSGGQLQRVVGAIAISCDPELLIADEPTTALDPTAQAAYLELLERLTNSYGLSLIIVTHDFGVVARICDEVMVMYAGQAVEHGTVRAIFDTPRHPYTKSLLAAAVHVSEAEGLLPTIEGHPPDLSDMRPGCSFSPRCPRADDRCRVSAPPLRNFSHQVASCWKAGEA